MDQKLAHQLIVLENKQLDKLELFETALKEQTKLLKENNSIMRELLNFFVSIDRRDQGFESEASQEYLAELEKDGFNPPTG